MGYYRGFIVCFFAWLFFIDSDANGQLISPGKLTASHAELEGLTNCTQCHTLGNRSADNGLCLDCHTPVASRIEAGTGFHASVIEQNCADCHKDHFGVEFIPVRLDTLAFEHDDTGYELTGSHVEASCRSCHNPEYIVADDVLAFKGEHDALDKTFLGVATECISCHLPESPHQLQFGEENCASCHKTEVWGEAPLFDHDDAEFKLTGKHVDVSCEGCHPTKETPAGEPFVQYVDLAFASCNSCHEDEHEGAFGTNCSSCHQTNGWLDVSGLDVSLFDHSTTDFDLVESHAQLECASCHQKPARRDDEIFITFSASTTANTYPGIPVENCESCHVDYHEGQLDPDPAGASCESCHGQTTWYPTSFDITRHNEVSTFELTGSHVATPCVSCHLADGQERPHFEITDTACIDCHKEDSPHGDQFITDGVEEPCASCHVTEDWLDATTLFDHDETEFPLTGKHLAAACSSCHKPAEGIQSSSALAESAPAIFRNTPQACVSCHEEDDPHRGQFEAAACSNCHGTTSFLISEFNHEDTAFPLTGEHVNVSCAQCHQNEAGPAETPFVRFKPLGTECQDCHGEE